MIYRKHNLLWYILCICFFPLFADSYSGSHSDEAVIVRAPVWVFLEPQPGVMRPEEQKTKQPPRKALTEISQMILEGMTYGWTFSYTPSDKKRKIAEEFILEPVQEIIPDGTRFSITELRPRYPYLYCWAEYRITDAMAKRKTEWIRSTYVTAKGIGAAPRKADTEGIRLAYKEAALSAIRNYMRKNEKNKPKGINGEMLIKENPRLYVSGGMFRTELTVYLYIKEVIPYSIF